MPVRICVPLVQHSPDEMLKAAHDARRGGADLLEFRLDAIRPSPRVEHVAYLLRRSPLPAVFTCRLSEQGGIADLPRELRLSVLLEALRLNAAYVDIEWPDETILHRKRGESKSRIIASFHDFKGVPKNLSAQLDRMERGPADVVKAAVAPSSATDSSALLELLKEGEKPRIVIGMGLPGVPTRIIGPLYGAEFTFAALTSDNGSAPGQPALDDMMNLYRVRNITGSTRILGVLGNPLGHSLSPLLHNTVFRELSIDAVYLPFEIKGDPAEFVEEWSALHGLHGASVTIPHKIGVMAACLGLDDSARKIGAANTLYSLPGGGFRGANTDAPAVTDALSDALGGKPLKGKKVLVLGAGGAARAAVYGLVTAGCRVVIANRTHEKAVSLAKAFGAQTVNWEDRNSADADILVNMTSSGMFPHVDEIPIDPSYIEKDLVVFDAVYNPLTTQLLAAAKERGATVVTGVEMFLRQAARQLQFWFGLEKPPLELMRRTLLEALGENH